jgi:basic membrane protein A and related proteins
MKLVAVLAVAGIVLAACGDDDDNGGASATTSGGATTTAAASSTTPGGTESTRPASGASTTSAGAAAPTGNVIGLVTDVGKVDDKSFNQSAWEGTQQAAKDLGGTADYIETLAASDYANNIKQFLDKGAKIIVTAGSALTEATITAAKANPDVHFIGLDQRQTETIPNLTGLVFDEDKAGFLAGALAGLLTKSNTVAAVLGTDQVPPVVAFKVGYENGAKYTNSGVNVLATFHPGGLDTAFVDPEWGATTARQAIDNGADVLFGAGGKTGNGALIEVARDADKFCIGVDSDQWETLPEAHPCLVTSAMKMITPGIAKLVEAAADGTIEPGNFSGDVGLADFHDLADRVPADVKTKIDELKPKVLSGEVPTGYKP